MRCPTCLGSGAIPDPKSHWPRTTMFTGTEAQWRAHVEVCDGIGCEWSAPMPDQPEGP